MCDQPAEKQVLLRIFGGVTLLLGFIEFIVDIVLYTDLTAPKLGAWWAALIILVTSGLAVISTSRGVVIAAMVLSVSLEMLRFINPSVH
jgi:capsular polysaccharide biosynthesis protein